MQSKDDSKYLRAGEHRFYVILHKRVEYAWIWVFWGPVGPGNSSLQLPSNDNS